MIDARTALSLFVLHRYSGFKALMVVRTAVQMAKDAPIDELPFMTRKMIRRMERGTITLLAVKTAGAFLMHAVEAELAEIQALTP